MKEVIRLVEYMAMGVHVKTISLESVYNMMLKIGQFLITRMEYAKVLHFLM